MTDRKKSTSAAMLKYHKKQLGQGTTRERKTTYKKPEKDVERAVLEWGCMNSIHLHVVEASSYDPRLGRKGVSKAPLGFPDVVGNTQDGHSLWIELKAKDRRSALRESQRSFLESKISANCFAVVVDSVEGLSQYWRGFWSLRTTQERQSFLLDCLPKKRQARDSKVNDEMGF
jgi:hypothetical protein